MLGKRTYRNYFYTPTGRTPKRRGINLTRPPTYRRNQGWQDWRAMKYIARRPLNLRTGGYLGKELKFIDNTSISTVSTAWQLEMFGSNAFNAVANGTGESERIGRKITNHSLYIRGKVWLSNVAVLGNRVRIVLIKDSQTNGAVLLPADVMTSAVDGFRNLEHVSRFTILYDKTFILNPTVFYDTSAAAQRSNTNVRHFSINAKLSGDTLFDGTTASISDITDNSYQLIAVADSSGSSISYNARFRFTG